MHELDECLRLARLIKDKEDIIREYRYKAMSPKNQIYSDMPKGGGVKGGTEVFLIRIERLEQQKDRLCSQRDKHWQIACIKFAECNINAEAIHLMRYRFYKGLSWKKSIFNMRERFKDSNWNENKCFSTYRSVLCKITKKDSENLCNIDN